MKIILTTHVKERRKKGYIPPKCLILFATFLIETHTLHNKDDGIYKFRKGGTQAIISKKNDKFIFITLFGPSGYIIDNTDYGIFNCVLQPKNRDAALQQRRITRKQQRKENRANKILSDPLKNLSLIYQKKLKKGTFEIIKLTPNEIIKIKTKISRTAYFYLKAKSNGYPFIELLGYDGAKIQIIHKNVFEQIL